MQVRIKATGEPVKVIGPPNRVGVLIQHTTNGCLEVVQVDELEPVAEEAS